MLKVITLAILCMSFSDVYSFSIFKDAIENEDCYLFLPCALGLTCYDYRCQVNTPDKTNEIAFAPLGPKCDWFHYCSNNSTCIKHRCQLNQMPITSIPQKNNNLKPEPIAVLPIPHTHTQQPQTELVSSTLPVKEQIASQLAQEAPKKPINYYS